MACLSAEKLDSKFKTLLGAIGCLLFVLFITLSAPIYLFRAIIALFAKHFRSDLGDTFNGQSGQFCGDYFNTKFPPRSNIVIPLIFVGGTSFEHVKAQILEKWINAKDKQSGKLIYEKFQQYPVTWLGFSFWKNTHDSFCIDKHVHKIAGVDTVVTDRQLTNIIEELLNSRSPPKQSPWDVYVIENYHNPKLLCDEGSRQSVFIVKFHHCLTDGYGILTALTEGLGENYTFDRLNIPKSQSRRRSFCQQLVYMLTLPLNVSIELSYVFSLIFRGNPWKIPDSRKDWYQVLARSELISIQLIKDIKNHFGVSFTSVLLSAISATIEKMLEENRNTVKSNLFKKQSMPCISIMPAVGIKNRRALETHSAGAFFDLPISVFGGSVERLRAVNGMLESKRHSVVPIVYQYYTTLLGSHFCRLGCLLAKNRQIPVALTNFAGVPNNLTLMGNANIIEAEGVAGGIEGEIGAVITVVSHNQHLRLSVAAERAVMTKKETELFAECIVEEINHLRELMQT